MHVLRFLQCADNINFGAALDACVKASTWRAASSLIVGLSQRSLQTTTVLENTLIDGLAQLSGWERPLDRLMAMRRQGISYNYASLGAALASSWKQALTTLNFARCLHLRPDVITSGAALKVLGGSAGNWENSLNFLFDMRLGGANPNKVCVTSATASCEHWQQALSLRRWSVSCLAQPRSFAFPAEPPCSKLMCNAHQVSSTLRWMMLG